MCFDFAKWFCLQCGSHTTTFIFRFASSMDRIGIKCKQPPAKHNAMEQSHSPARDEQGAEVPLEYDNDKVDYCKGRERNGVFFRMDILLFTW